MDRQIVAIVVGPMQRDLGVGDTQIGWLYGIHALFYAFVGAFNEFIFLGADGVRYSMMTMNCFFGLIRSLFLHLGRKHYALSMKNAESCDGA